LILAPDYGISAEKLATQIDWLQHTFSQRSAVALTLLHRGGDDAHKSLVLDSAARFQVPVVATGAVCLHVRSRKRLHDVLTAIRLGRSVAQCGQALQPNAEQHLRSRLRLANMLPPHTLAHTIVMAQQCDFSLDSLRYEYPDELVPAGQTPDTYLHQETWRGAHRRFPAGIPAAVQEQLNHELALITELAYAPYFLTVYDIVAFARSRQLGRLLLSGHYRS